MRRTVSALALAASLALASSAALSAGDVVRVSQADPYAGCSPAGQPGRNFPNTHVEPYVAVNPATVKRDRVNVVGVWQQDRWSNGGARGLVAGYSFDGGETWGQTPLPFNRCAPGGLDFERASDPWVSIGPDGTVYAVSLSFDATRPDNAVAAATSSDGGVTWTNVRILMADDEPTAANDKEAVTADPVKPGTAYVVWDRAALSDCDDEGCHDFSQPTWFSKTTDGGRSWSDPSIIVDTGSLTGTIGNEIVVDRGTGTLYNFFTSICFACAAPVPRFNAAYVKSTDGGEIWSDPQFIAPILAVGVRHPVSGAAVRTGPGLLPEALEAQSLPQSLPEALRALAPGDPIRTGDILLETAIDPRSGQLYVVWQDARFSGGRFDAIAFATSTDGGATWSDPALISTPTGRPAFTPSVQVNDRGLVAVTYYDFRKLQPGQTETLPTDYWITFSRDRGTNFGDEEHVAGSFNMLAAPVARGFFVGDYEGLATIGETFVPFFVQTNCLDNSCSARDGRPNPTNVFAGRFEP